MKKTGIIIIVTAVAALCITGAAYVNQNKFPWKTKAAQEKAVEYINQKYGLNVTVKNSEGDTIFSEGSPYHVVFEDETGMYFTVDVSSDYERCWDNYPDKVFEKTYEDKYGDELSAIWTGAEFTGVSLVSYDSTKYPDEAFADGSVDLDAFEEEANYYVYVFVPQKDDMTTYADEVNTTIELLKSEELNAESVHLIAKDNNKSKGYVFKSDDGAETVTDLLAHS